MDKPILELINISKFFSRDVINLAGDKEKEKHCVLDGLNITVERSSVTAILGGNGVGKTTLFNLISNLEKPDIGQIIYRDGERKVDLNLIRPYEVARRGIGRLFQTASIFKTMTILENMLVSASDRRLENPLSMFIRKKHIAAQERQRTEEALQIWLDFLGPDNPFHNNHKKLAGTLSLGQQKLLGFCRLLMGNHDLLLLDEPSAGINPELFSSLSHVFKKLKDLNKTVLLIEHNYEFVKSVADYCYILSEGKILSQGGTEKVLTQLSYM